MYLYFLSLSHSLSLHKFKRCAKVVSCLFSYYYFSFLLRLKPFYANKSKFTLVNAITSYFNHHWSIFVIQLNHSFIDTQFNQSKIVFYAQGELIYEANFECFRKSQKNSLLSIQVSNSWYPFFFVFFFS